MQRSADLDRNARVRPDVLSAALLDEIAERLYKLEQLLAKPKGFIHPINITVSGYAVIDFVREFPFTPMFSITIFNEGPNDLYIGLNTTQWKTPLKPGDNINIDLQSPKIKQIHLEVEGGKTTNVRGFGIY